MGRNLTTNRWVLKVLSVFLINQPVMCYLPCHILLPKEIKFCHRSLFKTLYFFSDTLWCANFVTARQGRNRSHMAKQRYLCTSRNLSSSEMSRELLSILLLKTHNNIKLDFLLASLCSGWSEIENQFWMQWKFVW